MQKGRNFFNIIIIIVAIALIGIIGYVAYYYISNYIALKEAEEAVDNFENNVIVVAIEDQIEEQQPIVEENQESEDNIEEHNTPTSSSRRSSSYTTTYKGYSMIGTMQIPKTGVKIPVVDEVTTQSITSAAAVLYGPGLNQIGNTVIIGHNYRNGTYFSNNKKLSLGDKIYITDMSGEQFEYIIYNKYETDDMDFSYANRETDGKREISLSTCTTDASVRLVIWAKEV